MNIIHQTIKDFLHKYKIDSSDFTYLVAFSGGYDSMCLLDSLKKVCPDNRIVAIHLNMSWLSVSVNKHYDNLLSCIVLRRRNIKIFNLRKCVANI